MKRILNIASLIVTLAILLPLGCAAQARIDTRKMKIADFTTKTIKVVLGSNPYTDDFLRDEVASRWRISPYEFCTVEEYEKLKTSSDWYFLRTVKVKQKGEKTDGLVFLTVEKGGLESSDDQRKLRFEVVGIPLCAADFPDGKEFVFLPGIIDILQEHITSSMISDKVAYLGFQDYANRVHKTRTKRIYLCRDDIAQEVTPAKLRGLLDDDIVVTDGEEACKVFSSGTYNTMVGYVVCPSEPQPGSWCYTMLIDAQTHELQYFSRHQIKAGKGAGFLLGDLKKITASRKRR